MSESETKFEVVEYIAQPELAQWSSKTQRKAPGRMAEWPTLTSCRLTRILFFDGMRIDGNEARLAARQPQQPCVSEISPCGREKPAVTRYVAVPPTLSSQATATDSKRP